MRRISKAFLLDCARQSLAVVLTGCCIYQQTAQAAGSATPLPTGGAYVAGSGSIKSSGNAVTINQSSLRGIIDWSTFSIGQGGTVTFQNGTGATLNRVTGSQMSTILGSLLASGSVYLINPEGVLIGPGGRVNTGGDFVASTLNVSPNLFLNGGSLLFEGTSPNMVVNLGDIFSSNGNIFLVGHAVNNSGSLSASQGSIGLAAGSEVLLKDSTADQRVFVKAAGGDVTNTGTISAAQVELKAKGGNIYALAGNTGGSIAANGTAQINGHVWLISEGGSTQVTGVIAAQNAGGSGGNIETSGQNLDISHATVKTGQGGNWLLDPIDVLIDSGAASTIENSLATTNVTVETTATSASGPGTQSPGNGDITVGSNIAWGSSNSLTLSAYRDIHLNDNVSISNSGAGNLTLRADNTSNGTGTVSFGTNANLNWSQSTGIASILYNPTDVEVRYDNPSDFSPYLTANSAWVAPAGHSVSSQLTAYMLVNNANDLSHLNNQLGGTFALGTNIDASSNGNFPEQATTSPGFTGTLDGFGNTISGLTMSRNAPALGLFGYVGQSGIIRNLNLTDMSVTQSNGTVGGEVGGLVGSNSGTLANINIGGSVQNANGPYQTGGVAGVNTATGVIYNVQSSVAIDETSSLVGPPSEAVGGIAADNEGVITNSTASGVITGSGNSYVGGMVGVNNGSIGNSSSSATVSDSNDGGVEVGGLVGSNTGTLTGVSASGNVSGSSLGVFYGGGLIGWSNSPLSGLSATGSVTTTSGNAEVGGLVGYQGSTIGGSHASGSVSGGAGSVLGGLAGQVDGAVSDSYGQGAVTLSGHGTAGGLAGQTGDAVTNSYATGNVQADGNPDYASYIGGLIGLANGSNAISGGSYASGNVSVTSRAAAGGLIGFNYAPANNVHATGTVSTGASSSAGGLIGNNQGVLNNVWAGPTTVTSVATVTVGNSSYAGGLIGNDSTQSALVSNASSTANVMAGNNSDAGGLIGRTYGAVSASNASGTATSGTSSDAGGLIGLSSAAAAAGSYATGAVSVGNGSAAGGLIGQITGAAVTNSYATGAVTGSVNGNIGGLVGYTNSSISGSHATGNVSDGGTNEGQEHTGGLAGKVDTNGSVSNSQASGNVTGTGSGGTYGGLIGTLYGTLTSDSNATGTVIAGNYAWAGGIVGEASTPLSGFTVIANVQAGNNSQLGGLVGHTTSTVSNSTSSGTLTGGVSSTVGGIGGEIDGAVTNASSSATVTGGDGSTVGGMAGFAYGTVTGSTASGAISGGANSLAGGLIGGSGGNVSGSSASGNVTGGFAAGGLIGATNGNVTVDTSNASGTVTTVIPEGAGAGGIVGGLIGIASGSVTNSHATGAISSGDGVSDCEGPCNMAGGLVGWMSTSNGPQNVSNSYATGNVSVGVGYEVGGLIGENHVPVTSSYATGNVQGGAYDAAGGLIGYTYANVSQSNATGNVSIGAADEADPFWNSIGGGLIGGTSNGVTVTGSYASGSVTGGDYTNIGGLIGATGSNGQITASYATGTVTGTTGVSAGGLVGFNNSPVSGSYATGNVTIGDSPGQSNPSGYAGGLLGLSSAGDVTSSYATGTVVAGVWGNSGGLAGAMWGDISSSHATGNVTTGYSGEAGGLTGESGGVISHSYATGNVTAGDDVYAGGLSGSALGNIDHSYATGNVTAGTSASFNDGCNCTYIGGLAGYSGATISTSFATGQVSAQGVGAAVGGLVGYSDSGTEISQSYATGQVSATGSGALAGGLVGDTLALVADSYATGSVSATGSGSIAGGLVGLLDNGSVDNPGTPVLQTSYSIGAVSGADTIGGLVGQNQGTANITDAYWDTTTSGQTNSAGGTGLTTRQWLVSGPAATNDPAWDFNNNWVAGYPYPVLRAFPYVLATLSTSGNRTYGGTDPGITLTSAVDQDSNNALGSINGTLVPVTAPTTTHVGTYAIGGSGQNAGPMVQLTYNGALTIDPETISLSGLLANNKTYDGTTAATLSLGSLAVGNLVGEDSVTLNSSGATAVFADKNAGTGKTVDVTGITLSGPDAGNYILAPLQTTTANIGPATLTETFTANNKVYDGTTAASAVLGTLSGLIGEDSAAVQSGTFNFSDKNAGTGKTVAGSAAVLTGPDAGNYTVDFVQNGTANITPAPLTASYTANTKVYDGTTAASATTALNGLFGSDSVAVAGDTYSFADKNAGSGKTVAESGGALTGADAGNYTVTFVQNGTGTITPATLTETFTANNKVYDSTTAATATLGTLSGLIGEDSATVQSGVFNFADKNAGTGKTVVGSAAVLSGPDASNYVVDFVQNGTATITPATVTETFTANNKVYDGTTAATATFSPLSGLLGGDSATMQSGTFTFSDKNAGTGKTVSGSAGVLSGPDAGNYVVDFVQNGTATITPATLTETFTASNKVYDGTTAATASLGTLSGLIGGDSAAVQSGVFNFADKNAGTGKTVSGSDGVLTGADAGNYVVTFVQNGTATITPATLTETFTASNKVYDGTTAATASLGTLSGLIGGDSVAVQSGVFNFSDKNAGTGKTVNGSDGVLTGADAGNYVVTFAQNGTATITPAQLFYTASSTGASRGYGAGNPALSGFITGLLGGDTLASVVSGSPVFLTSATPSSDAGKYSITGSGLTLISGNYTLAQAPGNGSAFTVNPITIEIGNAFRQSGQPNPAFTIVYSGQQSDYLKQLLASLVLVTNAPTSDIPGTYQITALIPSNLAGDILVQPGTLTITSGAAERQAALPAVLNTQAPAPSAPLSPLAAGLQFIPGNALSQFQVAILPSNGWAAGLDQNSPDSGALSYSSFTETSPDGRSKDKKSIYAAGAK